MQVILFEDQFVDQFYPFTLTKPLGHLVLGSSSLVEKWGRALSIEHHFVETREYLKPDLQAAPDVLSYYINARVVPNLKWIDMLTKMERNQAFTKNGVVVFARCNSSAVHSCEKVELEEEIQLMNSSTDLFRLAKTFIEFDAQFIENYTHVVPQGVTLIGPLENLHVHPSAKILNAVINVTEGPVVIDEDAEIMEGSLIRGPLYLGKHAVIKMGAKIYGPSIFGEECRIGGETSNVVFLPFSNKGHDGFLGNAVIGSWVNLGADTNCSNLKNNYSEVKLTTEFLDKAIPSGLTFCGALIGDHSKTGINTMLNTGTYIGVAANVFGGDFPSKTVKSFTWGNNETVHEFDKALETATRMMERRSKSLSNYDKRVLSHVFEMTAKARS